jgi:signal transduction histidine kinase
MGSLPTVRADAGQLYVVLLNLVQKAVKYSGQGPAKITIGSSHESGRPRIWVRDEGIGIAADRLQDIFEPFVRVDDRTEDAVEGLGIGLDTVRRIIESHRGAVGVESVPGLGTAVWFELPAQASDGAVSSGQSAG